MNSSALAFALAPGFGAWIAPALLQYRRGGWAWMGALLSAALLLLSAWEVRTDATVPVHAGAAPVIFTFIALGVASCAVGLYDRRPAALAMLVSLMALFMAMTTFPPWIWLAVGGATGLGWFFSRAPAPPTRDERAAEFAANRTRRARSIVRKLIRSGEFHWLPVYFLLRLSDLAREGIERSGSYRFADHIYRDQASGRGPLGRWLDRRVLDMKASRALRLRCLRAQTTLRAALEAWPACAAPLRVLAVPCGLPRDLTELAATLRRENPALVDRIAYTGIDIDPELLRLADAFTAGAGVPSRRFVRGNALVRGDFPAGGFHAVISTGLGEFLDRRELLTFYANVHAALLPGGTFYTSATARDPRSDAFLRAFELHSHYRTAEEITDLLRFLPWSRLQVERDPSGLQAFVTAVK